MLPWNFFYVAWNSVSCDGPLPNAKHLPRSSTSYFNTPEWRTLGMADPLNGGPSEWRTLGMADRNRLGLDKHLRRSSGSYFHTPEWRTLGMADPLNGGSSEWRTQTVLAWTQITAKYYSCKTPATLSVTNSRLSVFI